MYWMQQMDIDVVATAAFVICAALWTWYVRSRVFWWLEKIFILWPGCKSPPTFRARFCRKFCDLYTSIYGNEL